MNVTFNNLIVGDNYSRHSLALRWEYGGMQALCRGVVTPKNTNFIIFFVTNHKRDGDEQYNDNLEEEILCWEGPNDHFAEQRIVDSVNSEDNIHLFYRNFHDELFIYKGIIMLCDYKLNINKPSAFIFKLQQQ